MSSMATVFKTWIPQDQINITFRFLKRHADQMTPDKGLSAVNITQLMRNLSSYSNEIALAVEHLYCYEVSERKCFIKKTSQNIIGSVPGLIELVVAAAEEYKALAKIGIDDPYSPGPDC
jgi:hypothetical protein